mmetsp:Transcript_9902/g.36257  ORF Transcript_9902/g.36257 Transcript_9902/m.36257 type:complete len:110 (-) Transcript_9902:68-397(-)|eukprot:scaffold2645_cov378-Prasinococcus_capsulatus_cf.AAC.27
MARTVFAESTEEVHAIFDKYREQYELPGLRLQYNMANGFFLQISIKELGDNSLPQVFCQLARKGNSYRFTSPELISMNVKNTEAHEECLILTENVLEVSACSACTIRRC